MAWWLSRSSASLLPLTTRTFTPVAPFARFSIELGSGAGKGGGGAIREAGGSFGKMAAAHEEQYFRELQVHQLRMLKKRVYGQVSHHEEKVTWHQAAVKRQGVKKKDFNDLLRESLSYPSLS